MNSIHLHLPLDRRTRRRPRTIPRRINLHLHQIFIQPPKRSPRSSAGAAIQRDTLGASSQRAAAVVCVLGGAAGAAERFAKELLDHGLEDGEAAAGDADVDLDGGPDERAGVGVGAVGEGDGGDGVGADDADAADAGGGVRLVMMATG